MLKVLCYEHNNPTRPLANCLLGVMRLLHTFQGQDRVPAVAIDIGMSNAGRMALLLNVLWSIGKSALKVQLVLRIEWAPVSFPFDPIEHEANILSYAKLRALLQERGCWLRRWGGWLKVYAVYHSCCVDPYCPRPPMSNHYVYREPVLRREECRGPAQASKERWMCGDWTGDCVEVVEPSDAVQARRDWYDLANVLHVSVFKPGPSLQC